MGRILTDAEIGVKIKEFRLQVGLTQEGLAEKLEITFQQVQKYERGLTKVNIARLQQMAQIFDVPVAAFFADSHVAYNITEDESRLLKAFRQIGDDLRNNVLTIVENLTKSRV